MVLLRLGPFIDAEYDFGGLPAWLLTLRDPPLRAIRTNDPAFTAAVTRWWKTLLPTVRPMLWENGGPVVMVQIENEYGAFAGAGAAAPTAAETAYKSLLISLARELLGPTALIFTTDGDRLPEMRRGSFNDSRVYSAPDFGPGDPGFRGVAEMVQAAAALRAMNPAGKAPLLCSEFYSGWATHWGQNVPTATSTQWLVGNLSTWLQFTNAAAANGHQRLSASVNLYMAHGGSTVGWWGGGDADAQPDGSCIENYTSYTASYDFNAPIDEAGGHGIGSDSADKFAAIRALLAPITHPPPEPPPLPRRSYGVVQMAAASRPLTALATLQALVPTGAVTSIAPRPMEDIGALYGFALYEATLPVSANNNTENRQLTIAGGARDRVIALINGKRVATVWRGDVKGCADEVALSLPPASSEAPERLQLLVEITGRLAYGIQMQADALRGKGLVGGPQPHSAAAVTLDGVGVRGPWTQWALPLDSMQLQRWPNATEFEHEVVALRNTVGEWDAAPPKLFRGSFSIAAGDVADCWVDMAGWSKGTVSINGVDIGRYWSKGPRSSLYIPAPLLRPGDNTVLVFELEPTQAMENGYRVQLRDAPTLVVNHNLELQHDERAAAQTSQQSPQRSTRS